jgi:hypothetical protein
MLIISRGHSAGIPKPVSDSLIKLPDVIHPGNHSEDHCHHDDKICMGRPRTTEIGQKNTAEQCSKAELDCAVIMALARDKCSDGENDDEYYLGCSKGGLPQIGYSGMYTTVHGKIVVSHLECSRRMNLACLNDDMLITLLSEQPDYDGCICPIIAIVGQAQIEIFKQDETLIVFSDYICVSRGSRCWRTRHDYSDFC